MFKPSGHYGPWRLIISLCPIITMLLLPIIARSAAEVAESDSYSDQTLNSLTLDRAVEFALDNNLSLRTARTRIREQQGSLTHASRSVPSNPVLETRTGYRTRPGSDSVDVGIRVSQEFWIGGQGELMQAAASKRLTAAQAQYDFLKTTVAARARRAFLNVLWAQESRQTAHRALKLARQLEGYTKQQLQAGETTRLDLNTARLGTAQARNALEKAKAAQKRARIELSRVLSVPPEALGTIKGTLNLDPVDLPDRNELARRSVQRRRDLAAAAQEITAARKELELSRRQIIPNLTVFASFEREGGDDYIPGVGVSLPLPLLHQYEGETQQASARLQRSLAARDDLLLSVKNELALAMADYEAARQRVKIIGNQMLTAAEENVELTLAAFRAGKVGAASLSVAQDNLLNVRDEYLQSLDNLITAGGDLERTTGGLLFLAGANANDDLSPARPAPVKTMGVSNDVK